MIHSGTDFALDHSVQETPRRDIHAFLIVHPHYNIARFSTAIGNCKLKILNLWNDCRSYIVLKIRENLSSLGKKYHKFT